MMEVLTDRLKEETQICRNMYRQMQNIRGERGVLRKYVWEALLLEAILYSKTLQAS